MVGGWEGLGVCPVVAGDIGRRHLISCSGQLMCGSVVITCWSCILVALWENTYIDKMQTICLLETYYNWLNKFVFAKQMMDKAFQGDIIPVEQFAKMGITGNREGTNIRTLLWHCSGITQNRSNRKCGLGQLLWCCCSPTCKYTSSKFQGLQSDGGNDVILAWNHDMVSKNSIWSEQNLIWWYGFGPFHGTGPGQWCPPPQDSWLFAHWWKTYTAILAMESHLLAHGHRMPLPCLWFFTWMTLTSFTWQSECLWMRNSCS